MRSPAYVRIPADMNVGVDEVAVDGVNAVLLVESVGAFSVRGSRSLALARLLLWLPSGSRLEIG